MVEKDNAILPHIENWVLLQKLGHGKFGAGYLALDSNSGQLVCVKVFANSLEDPVSKKTFMAEVEAGNAGLNHQNLLRLISYGHSEINLNGTPLGSK